MPILEWCSTMRNINIHQEVSTPESTWYVPTYLGTHPLKQLFRTQSSVVFSGPSMTEQRQARRGSAPTEQTRDFHDYEASLENTDNRALVAANRYPDGDWSSPADLNGLENNAGPVHIVVSYDYPPTVTLSSLSSSFSSSPSSSAGEARQSSRGPAVVLDHPPVMAPLSSGERPGTNETAPRTNPSAINVNAIHELLRSHKQQRGSTITNGQLHPMEARESDGQADLERACSENTMDGQLHLTEQWEHYGQADPERAGSDTGAVAGSDSLDWETRHAEEAD